MTQLQKYTWLIDTIMRAGKITLKDLSEKWERNRELNNEGTPLYRPTFNHWREAIADQFGIIISCQRSEGYPYYIENPEHITGDELRRWMLDSFAVGNVIGDNLALKGRILVEPIPSGREFLASILNAMRDNHIVEISYRKFGKPDALTFPVKPYCVKLFGNRWYLLAYNDYCKGLRIYGLDRMEGVTVTEETFRLPKDFSAEEYFAPFFGIVTDEHKKPERIIFRAYENQRDYLKSLPIHHSQRLISECEDYAEFEIYVAPTYDLVNELFKNANWIEVMSPASLRKEMKRWADLTAALYKND